MGGGVGSAYHGGGKEADMDRTVLGGVLMAFGAAVVAFFVLADPIGVTFGDGGFGWIEVVAFIIGIAAFVAGVAVALVERGETRRPLPH